MKRRHCTNNLTNEKILFPPTYMNSTSKTTFKIYNKNPDHLIYQWRRFATEAEEQSILSECDPYDPNGREKTKTILLFNSSLLKISPIEGDIWGNSGTEFIVEFCPTSPSIETQVAYLYNTQTKERIPYTFQGEGLPPSASFNVQQINLGHISLDQLYEYRVTLRNTSLIPLEYQLIERNLSFPIIKFSPTHEYLNIDEEVPINIVVEANHVGQFNESFEFKILNIGDRHGPELTLFGRVVGPTFNISQKSIDFGTVSYGFKYSQEIILENTSEIHFDYRFELVSNSSFELREFNISPDIGTIPSYSKEKIMVEFIPTNIKKYSVTLQLKSDKFSDSLMIIPITANCICPDLTIVNPFLNMGDLFLKYKYTTNLILKNSSKYPAKIEYVESDDLSNFDANVSPGKYNGVVPANSETEFPIYVEPVRLGHMSFVRFLKLAGSNDSLLRFDIDCVCIGPHILFSVEKIDFGKVEILTDAESTFTITNDSLIPANFKAHVQSKTGAFSIKTDSGHIEPHESIDFTVSAYLDDNVSFDGTLAFLFEHKKPIELNIHAKGEGAGLISSIDMKKLDLKCALTDAPVIQNFKIENVTRRPHELRWTQTKPNVNSQSYSTRFNFEVQPETIVLEPKSSADFTFSFFANGPCTFSLQPHCEASVSKKKSDVFKPKITGEFVKPYITFEKELIKFDYIHDITQEEELTGNINSRSIISPSQELLQPMIYENSITNMDDKVPLVMHAQVDAPFFIVPDTFDLEPTSTVKFDVIFKPEFKKDFSSQKIESKCIFSIEGNPQQYSINLEASMIFPNLSFEPELIQFGRILKNTEYNKIIHVTNTSAVPVSFVWELLPKQKGFQIGEIFDISPIRGYIDVGNSIDIHVTFFALDNENTFEGIAVCHVIGGPDYTIDLIGTSASVKYEIGPKLFDFGMCNLAQKQEDTIYLENKSDIPLLYRAKIPKNCSMSSIVVEPNEGAVEAGKTQKLTVSVVLGYPTFLKDSFIIQIGKIVDEEFTVQAEGFFPQIQTTLPREIPLPEDNISIVEKEFLFEKLKELSTMPTFMNTLQLMANTNFSKINKFNGITLSQFQVDFGKLVLGQTKSFQYSLKNVTVSPISFEIDVRSIESTGFTIEPHSFIDVQPNEEFQITISFDASNRTKDGEGEENYSIPILFSAGLASLLTIKSTISIPTINLSIDNFEFDLTFVGQIRTMTFQVINSNLIPIEYAIENPYGETKPKSKKTIPQIFTASPKTGYLPPSSYQNISISFSPVESGEFSIDFPITIKNCNQPKYFSVKGNGAQLKLKFEPSQMKFQSIHPFDEALTADIDIINPTEYPIDVFSPQFDLQIENAILLRKFKESKSDDDEQDEMNQIDNKPDTRVRPLSICVIVNGPSKSGKTTLSRLVSKYLGDCPIISLKELWKDLIMNNCDDPNEFITLFSNEISNDKYCFGFVIDGLDAYPEPPETEAYLQTLMKQKHLTDDLTKNPFDEASGDYRTSLEHALYYILQGLNGQFVFQIALQAKQDAIQKHIPPEENEAKSAESQEKEEMLSIMNMNEEDYMKLSEEEQEAIDKKRVEYRKKYLESQGIDINTIFGAPSQTGKNSKRSLANSRKNASALKSTNSIASRHSVVKAQKKLQIGKNQLPLTSPYDFSILVFTYTLGRISKSIESNSDKFQVIDPIELVQKSSEGSIGHHLNTILLDSFNSIEVLDQQMKEFLPTLTDIQQKIISELSPEPTLFIPKYGYDQFGSVKDDLELLPILKQFSISTKEKPGEFPVFEKSKTTGKNSRRKSSRLTSNFSLTQNLDEMNFHKRYHIEPGQKETITIQFTSEEIGNFDDSFIFSIENCQTVFYKLPVSGKCLYPDVDRNPASVFKSIVPTLNNRTRLSYVTDLNEFHFGPLLVAKERAKNQPYQYRQAMQFTNTTPFDAIVTPFLRAQSSKVPAWALEDSNAITIPPGESKEIAICFHPVELSTYTSTVELFIQDNPEPFSFNFVAEACAPSVELTPTTLDFEKILLKQMKTLEFTIKNPNKIPAIWRIAKPAQFAGIFTFSKVEGTIPPKGSSNVSVTYSSAKPQLIKKHLQIEVLDSTKQKTYQSPQIQMIAESFDVTFDFLYPKGLMNLEYGLMKCEQTKSITCTLKNKGKYPSTFAFKCIHKKLQRFLTIQPESGTISPNEKPLNIVFTFCSNKVVRINNEDAVSLTICDGISETEMANINLTATIESLFNEYKLSFDKDNLLDFGPLPTGKTCQKEFTIENIGMFPFDFELQPKIDVVEPAPAIQNTQRHGRKAPVRQTSPSRQKKGKLQTGLFTISPNNGSISPGESSTITVDFGGTTAQQCDNSVLLKIHEVAPEDPSHDGLELHFKGETFSPGIEIGDVEKIFPKQNLCLRFDIMKNDTTAFLEDEQIFHFSPILIGAKKTTCVVLKNIYPVPCVIDASVKPSNTKKKMTVLPFELSSENIEIPPLESREVELTFAPTVVGNFSGLFKAEVKGSNGSDTLKFGVEGVAALPMISLLENDSIIIKKAKETTTKPRHPQTPRSRTSSKIIEKTPTKRVLDPNDMSAPTEAIVSFGKTLVNTQKIKHINVKNDSVIPAKLSIMSHHAAEFSIENVDCSKEIDLAPQQILSIAVLYSPSESHKSEFAMVIRVQDNHDSDISLNFVGEGSEEDIILEGIPGDDNNLIIKDTAVSKAQTTTFTMKNIRNTDFRFAWHENNDFHFSPRVGHLRKLSSKTVKVTFSSNVPITYDKLKTICQLTKIELNDKNAPDWDDSMADIRFVCRDTLLPQYGISPPLTNDEKRKSLRKLSSSRKFSTLRQSRISSARRNRNKGSINSPDTISPVVTEVAGDLVKVVEVKPEPQYTTLPGKCQEICLYASAVVDNVSYELSDDEISFAPTMMFETRTVEVTIKNTCNIRFDYTWHTTKFMTIGSDYALTHKSPFSIMPESGFINSGSETVFKISFSPEEVDDFSATLVCDIPYLEHMDPPMILVTGISTRPLCHFRVELSDYISAGRRHPDYTYPLPDDVRVIELFTSKIGKRTLRKFQVINTTAHPYEVVWQKDPNNNNDSIVCETPVALVSSGTAYPIAFSYMPKSVKTVESLWTFTIPEHHVSVPFLFVGRLMPK